MTIPTKLNKKAKSEFGSGLVICLVKFAEHAEAWIKWRDQYKQMHAANPELFDESGAVEIFFYGASDHLYDMEIPEKYSKTKIARKIVELKSMALHIGHGIQRGNHTEADVIKAYDLCREIALLIDKDLGLKPDIGKW
ncbi:unnamed protein product [marine sediment metagenome]|uniref:Uncharacterized protein n=1 Tax=marine sediment metagenome TaxID=412755 RepID=X1W2H9_9ZZZZ